MKSKPNKIKTAQARSLQRVVRPPFKIYQTVRHKLTGEIMVVSEILCDVVVLKPAISQVVVTKWGYDHWEVV